MSIPKTLVNCLSMKSGGGRAHLANLLPRLANKYQNIQPNQFYLLVDLSQQKEFAAITNCEIILLEKESLGGIRRILWEKRNLPQIVRKYGIDLVFTPHQVISAKTDAHNVVFLGNMEPFLFHRFQYSWKTWLRNYLLRRASLATLTQANQIIACSHFVGEHLRTCDGINPEKFHHVYHGRDTDFASLGTGRSDLLPVREPFFLTCGSLLPYRRCEDVLFAFEEYCKENPKSKHYLLIAGTGNDSRYSKLLESIVSRSRVGERMKFLGHVDRSTMSQLYANCDACILATEIEACPITAIEALTSGCVIIASDMPPLPEIFEDTAVYYKPRDIEDCANKMTNMIEQPNLAKAFRQAAMQRAEIFDWDTCAQETFNVLINS